jgi:hypothetical protein
MNIRPYRRLYIKSFQKRTLLVFELCVNSFIKFHATEIMDLEIYIAIL